MDIGANHINQHIHAQVIICGWLCRLFSPNGMKRRLTIFFFIFGILAHPLLGYNPYRALSFSAEAYDEKDASGHFVQDFKREYYFNFHNVVESVPVYIMVYRSYRGDYCHYEYQISGAQRVYSTRHVDVYGLQVPLSGGRIVVTEQLKPVEMKATSAKVWDAKKKAKNKQPDNIKRIKQRWPKISISDPIPLCVNLDQNPVPPMEKITTGAVIPLNDDDDNQNGQADWKDEVNKGEDNELVRLTVQHPPGVPVNLTWDPAIVRLYKTPTKKYKGEYSSLMGDGNVSYKGYDNQIVYVEGISPGTTFLTVTGPGGFTDRLKITVVSTNVKIMDARVFGPKMYNNGTAGLYIQDLRVGVAPDYYVDGALADGTSLCVIRMLPVTRDNNVWTVELSNTGDTSPGQSHILGSVHVGDVNNLPILPAGERQINGPSSCGTTSSDFSGGLAFYRPPNNFLIGGKNVDVASFDIVIKNNGTEVRRKPFYLARPPVMAIHGIFSSEDIWKTPVWQSLSGYKIDINTVDYSLDSSQGPSDVYHILAKAIEDRLAAYRAGYTSYDGATRRYAATRADVIGHSQGGQVARFYIAGMPSGSRRRDSYNAWPDFDNTRDPNSPIGRWPYLRDKNFGAGSIRRLITLGSPFKGSPWASATAPWLAPNNDDYKNIFIGTHGLWADSWSPNLTFQCMFWKNLSDYNDGPRPVTCLMDNSEGSRILTLMSDGSYPVGTKAVRWWPVVGIAGLMFDDPWGTTSGDMFQVCYNMLKFVTGVPGASELHAIEKLNPSVCDWIVPDYSQCNVVRGTALRGGIHQGTTHFKIPGFEAEYTSPAVAKQVLDILCEEANNSNTFPLR